MQVRRHYARSPIVEAMIDIQVRLPNTVTLDTLRQVHTGEETKYPTQRNRVALQAHVIAGSQVGAAAEQTQLGYAFLSPDERRVFQARLNGFTLNWLKPYQRWEDLRDEARRLWNVYRLATRPEAITRIAVRYIDRFDLPMPIADFKDYLRTVPEVSSDLPEQALSGYVMRLEIPQPSLQAKLILTQAMVPPPHAGVVSVLLDIDLFRESQDNIEEEGLWTLLEQLHARQYEVFESCITDRAREVIG